MFYFSIENVEKTIIKKDFLYAKDASSRMFP